jgi:hypothetical protein
MVTSKLLSGLTWNTVALPKAPKGVFKASNVAMHLWVFVEKCRDFKHKRYGNSPCFVQFKQETVEFFGAAGRKLPAQTTGWETRGVAPKQIKTEAGQQR